MQREEKNKASESRRFNYKKGVKGGNVDGGHQMSQVPSSSSEPTLVQMNAPIGPSLRETSSWSNPSDTTRISQHKDIQFNVVDAMNPIGDLKEKKKSREEVELDELKDEFRSLVVPLMKKITNENPPDLVAYCAQYFQELLVLREEEKKISNCKLLNDFNGKNGKGYPEDQIEKSSSLPTLFQMNDSFGPLLFENISWNDKPSAPWTVKNTNNLEAAEKKIGDQANKKEKFYKKEDEHLLKETERKSENLNNHRSSDRKAKEKRVSFDNGKKTPEHENAKSDIHVSSQSSKNFRKRWLEPDTLVNKITKSPTSSGSDSNSSDSDDFDTSYEMLQNEETIPLNPKVEDSISDSSYERSLPHEKDNTRVDGTCLKRKESPPEKQELSVEEVEGFAQSLFQKLRQNIQLAEVDIKERIQQIKSVKSHAPVNNQSQLLPRKKRSITTLDSSFKDGDKDSRAIYSGSDPDVPKGLLKSAKDPRRNHKTKTDASQDVQSYAKNTERRKEEGNKNRPLVSQGFSNPAFSFDQEITHSNNSVFMRQRKHEWIQLSSTDSTQQARNVRAPTNLPPVRSGCVRPIPTYPSSSRLPMRPPGNSNISNIGDGDVLSLHQNFCSIAIETDNPTTIERSAGSNSRIRPSRNIGSNNFHDAPKREKSPNREEINQKNSTALKGNCSKGCRTEKTEAPVEILQEKSQSIIAEDVNRLSEDIAKKSGLEKKLSDLDLDRIKSSNLNPCAPVFSPNSRRLVPTTNEATNTSTTNDSEEGRRRWDRTPRLDIALLTDTDLNIDAVAWDCLRTRNPQADEGGAQGLDGGVREFETAIERSDGNNYDDAGSESQNNTKTVEGDRTPSTKHNTKADGKFEQAEPSLNPACGDFVLSEDSADKPLQNGTVEENSNSPSSPGSDDSVEGKDKAEESERRLDEEGLNFACLSGSGSSEGYPSELSDEEEYEEEK